jgi:hypothetical protein
MQSARRLNKTGTARQISDATARERQDALAHVFTIAKVYQLY